MAMLSPGCSPSASSAPASRWTRSDACRYVSRVSPSTMATVSPYSLTTWLRRSWSSRPATAHPPARCRPDTTPSAERGCEPALVRLSATRCGELLGEDGEEAIDLVRGGAGAEAEAHARDRSPDG